MSEPLVLVVLLGTTVDPTTEGMLTAARQALGPEATVLADTSSVSSDADALAIGERVQARAIVRVTWSDDLSRVARLHVHVAPSADTEWTDQEIAFAPFDAVSERGRTIGYALASMVQRLELARAEEAERAPPPVVEAPKPPLIEVAPTPPPPIETRPVRTPERRHARDLDVFLEGQGALGGGATSGGSAAGVRWWPLANAGVRAAAGARVGSIADAAATTMFASAGPGYRVRTGPLELGARADFIVFRHAVSRTQGTETMRSRWIGGLDLMLEAGVELGSRMGLLVAVGPEWAFGPTEVRVGGVRVADIPPVRGIGEIGLRIRF